MKGNDKKQPGRENSKEDPGLFAVFAQFVFLLAVSLPFSCCFRVIRVIRGYFSARSGMKVKV
jgi:hypothetical protein